MKITIIKLTAGFLELDHQRLKRIPILMHMHDSKSYDFFIKYLASSPFS